MRGASLKLTVAVFAAMGWHDPLGAQSMTFVDVAPGNGLDYGEKAFKPGCAVGDYNGDGWLDVCLWASGDEGTRLFRNNGDKTFSDVTASVLPPNPVEASQVMFADLDNDGDPDLLFARRYGAVDDVGFYYYRNDGGIFVEGIVSPDLARGEQFGGMAVGDLDKDGDLDIVMMYQGDGVLGGSGFYLRNDGIENIVDATASFGAGLSSIRRSWGVVLADFNDDGLSDLHTAIDFGHDYQCRNMGGGTFQDVSVLVGVSNFGSDMGLAIGDIENDGDLDIFSTNIAPHVLYVNDGSGVFTDDANGRGVSGVFGQFGWGTALIDLDHDTDLDIVLASQNDMGSLFENDGTGCFTDVVAGSGLNMGGFGLVPFDYDNDGDMDLLVTHGVGRAKLFENTSPALVGRHWLMVRLQGTHSNRAGIGAKVTLTTGSVTMIREILGGYSFVSGPPYEAHFGMGSSATATTVRIDWPSGMVQTLTDVAADQYLTVVEPIGECLQNADCDDIDVCTFDQCDDVGTCFHTPNVYGDVDHDGDVDLFDLFCILNGFSGDFSVCSLEDDDLEPCEGDGDIDLFDLFAVLNAFTETDPCCGGLP